VTLEPSPQDRRTAAAMALALLRWHLFDFGVVDVTVDIAGARCRVTGYTPRYRFVRFTWPDGTPDRFSRIDFMRDLWQRGAVHFHNFDEVTR
jgi:hypothetical protein